jgi:type IV pilus assembly protein PilB
MVGEIRDKETASLAINAALTGHLVLSSIHTNTAAGAIPRLVDLGAEPFLISSTLNVILGQRLVRKLCPEKLKYKLKEVEIKNLRKDCDLDKILENLKEEKIIRGKSDWSKIDFFRPKPSKECTDGHKGRIGIYETLLVTESIKELIVKKSDAGQIQAQAQREGMTTMIEDGFLKAAQGITSIEEILRVIIS